MSEDFERQIQLEIEYLKQAHPEKFSHPERKEDEVFLTNQPNTDLSWTSYKSARLGSTAYDKTEKVLDNFYPVFVNINEYMTGYLRSLNPDPNTD